MRGVQAVGDLQAQPGFSTSSARPNTRLGGALPGVSGHDATRPDIDLVQQLRGEAGEAQVHGARLGLAENGGGFHGLEEAACVVTVLERCDSK